MLHILNQRKVLGAEADSSARNPPPRCHPETRKDLRERIENWVTSPRRYWNMLWLMGSAGVGKSAVAQTISEYCQQIGRLGASFFFSRLQNRDKYEGVIPTIVYQLAVRHAGYKNLITQIIAEDPSILDKTLSIQFNKLIVEPIVPLICQDPLLVAYPLVIVLDGLDECEDEDAQCEIIELISEHIRRTRSSPFLWMVCSRPEWHLKQIFLRADFSVDCQHEELTCDAAVDAEDVYRVLKDGFQNIRKKYSWDIGGPEAEVPWPAEAQLQRLAYAVGGLFILASTILKFVGDDEFADPDTHLYICLSFLGNTRAPNARNPLHGLDLLYRQILSTVPLPILETAKRIIALSILYPLKQSSNAPNLFALDIANFLCLDQAAFYRTLRKLHSVMEVPSPKGAHNRPVKAFHASFIDFLRDPKRSGLFALDIDQIRYEFAVLSIRWYNRWIQSNCKIQRQSHLRHVVPVVWKLTITPTDCGCTCGVDTPLEPKWTSKKSTQEGRVDAHSRINKFVAANCWDMCRLVGESRRSDIIKELRTFNFCHLYTMDRLQQHAFSQLLVWLDKKSVSNSTPSVVS